MRKTMIGAVLALSALCGPAAAEFEGLPMDLFFAKDRQAFFSAVRQGDRERAMEILRAAPGTGPVIESCMRDMRTAYLALPCAVRALELQRAGLEYDAAIRAARAAR